MNIRNQLFYDYIFRDRADVDASIKNTPPERQAALRASKVKDVRNFFFEEKDSLVVGQSKRALIMPDDRADFRRALRQLNAKHLETILFENASEPLPEAKEGAYTFPDEKAIESQFRELENKQRFFPASEEKQALEKFKSFFKVAKLIGDFAEKDKDTTDDLAYQHAYKLLILFGDQDNPEKYFLPFDTYIKQHNYAAELRPLRDALVFNLPKKTPDTPVTLNTWRDLIQKKGSRIFTLFKYADRMEQGIQKEKPKTYDQLFSIAKLVAYKNRDKYPELADVGLYNDVRETLFDQCLEIEKRRKLTDDLPSIMIDGKDVGHPGYHFLKLPIDDPRAYFLGHITNCCQSIGLGSEECVIDGLTLKDNGFYVLLKETKKTPPGATPPSPTIPKGENGYSINYNQYELVGQGYLWRTNLNNLTFDSWENLRRTQLKKKSGNLVKNLQDDAVIVPILKEFAKQVIEQKDSTVLRVTIGQGGKTPKEFFPTEISGPEKLVKGKHYPDSMVQRLILCNTQKQEQLVHSLQLKLSEILSKDSVPEKTIEPSLLEKLINTSQIVSISQANAVIELLNNDTIKSFFRESKNYESLLAIFEIESKFSDTTDLFKCAGYTWNILTYLNHASLCTQENLAKTIPILTNSITITNLEAGMAKLKRANLLDAKWLDMLLKMPENANYFATSLVALNDSKINYDYRYFLYRAVESGEMELINQILDNQKIDKKALLETREKAEAMPLHAAITSNSIEAMQKLISLKADINAGNLTGESPLLLALNEKKETVFNFLLDNKADVNKPDINGVTALIAALNQKRFDLIGKLLEQKNVDVNVRDFLDEGESLLSCLIRNRQQSLVQAVIERKADINFKDWHGTPLHYAVTHESLEIAEDLLKNKADVNAKGQSDRSALHLAIRNPAMVELLLKYGADVNAIDQGQTTPLHKAASADNPDTVKLLVEAKADISAINRREQTALELTDNDDVRAILQFKNVQPDHLSWIKNQVEKIQQHEVGLRYAVKSKNFQDSVFTVLEEKISDAAKMMKCVELFRNELNHVETPSSPHPAALFKAATAESDFCRAICSLLIKIESELCRTSVKLVDEKYKPLDKDFLDEVPRVAGVAPKP